MEVAGSEVVSLAVDRSQVVSQSGYGYGYDCGSDGLDVVVLEVMARRMSGAFAVFPEFGGISALGDSNE